MDCSLARLVIGWDQEKKAVRQIRSIWQLVRTYCFPHVFTDGLTGESRT